MPNEHEAAALSMQNAAGEIVAILTERMHSLGAARDMVSEVSGTLISAAWMMQKLWEGEHARPAFVARRYSIGIWARMVRLASAVHFTCCNPRQSNARPLCAPDRPVAVPDPRGGAWE